MKDANVDLFEVISTLRAVRRLKSDAIAEDVLEHLIFCATRAPSAANGQPWEFIIVTDADLRRRIGEIYTQASGRLFQHLLDTSTADATKRVYRDALHLSAHLGEAPAIIVVCTPVSDDWPLARRLPSVYPAVQNLLLAARGHGLGSTLTTVHKRRESDMKTALGIPDNMETVCLIPVGYPTNPERAFRPVSSRRPVSEVLHWQQFARGHTTQVSGK